MANHAHPHTLRNSLIVAVVLALAAGGWWLVKRRAAQHAPVFEYETVAIDRGAIRAKVTATGTVNPITQVQVGSQVSGTISELGADFNSQVVPGQLLAQIDPRPFQAAVNQAQANLLAAQANARKARAAANDARAIANRNRELASQKLVAQQTADTAEANAKVAEAAVDAAVAAQTQAKSALDTSKLNLSYTRIVSPIRGTVITRNVDRGQTVAASFAAPTLFLIGEDLAKMQVDTNIAEADVGRLQPGMTATFTVDAYPSQPFQGRIREVRNSPQVIQNVVTYDAVIDVDNSALLLKPGMTANLEVVYADRSDALRVPNAALRFHPTTAQLGGRQVPAAPLGKRVVWVQRGARLEPVIFEPGVSDGTWTEVKSGELAPGDRAATEAIAAVKKGPM